MNRAEQNIKMAADLYEARRAAKFLLGVGYMDALQPYRDFITRVMADEELPALRAMIKIGKCIPPSDAIPMMCLMAAAVEIMEPSAGSTAKEPPMSLYADENKRFQTRSYWTIPTWTRRCRRRR